MEMWWQASARCLTTCLAAVPSLLYLSITVTDLRGGSGPRGVLVTLILASLFVALAVSVWRRQHAGYVVLALIAFIAFFNSGPLWLRATCFTYGAVTAVCLYVTWPRLRGDVAPVPANG